MCQFLHHRRSDVTKWNRKIDRVLNKFVWQTRDIDRRKNGKENEVVVVVGVGEGNNWSTQGEGNSADTFFVAQTLRRMRTELNYLRETESKFETMRDECVRNG